MQLLHLIPFLAAVLQPVLPIHGTVLGVTANHHAIIRSDPVTRVLPSLTRAYRVEPAIHLAPGLGVDGFLDRSTTPWRWYDASVAAKFVPGLPDAGKVFPLDIGSPMPATKLVDQNGRIVDLASSFPNRTLIISFIFTRCPDRDWCPAVSSKFSSMQTRLDPARFHLIEISLDPAYDSPPVLHTYAANFNANPAMWSLLTGQQHEIQALLNRFGISSLRVGDAQFIHNDKVFITAPDGKIASIVNTVGFDPQTLIAQARHIAALHSNLFGRLELAIIAGAAALCGGSQFAGIVLLETVLFLIIAALSAVLLTWVARALWRNA